MNVRFDGLDVEGPKLYLMIFLLHVGKRLDRNTAKVDEEEIEKMKNGLLDLGIRSPGYKNDILWSKVNHKMLINLRLVCVSCFYFYFYFCFSFLINVM